MKEQKNRLPRTATAPADRQTDRPAHKKCTFLASAPPPPPSSSTPSWLCHSVEFRNRQNVKPTWGHTRFLAPNLRTEQTKGDGRKDRNVVNRQKRERESRHPRPWRCVVRTSPAMPSLPNTGHTTFLSFFLSFFGIRYQWQLRRTTAWDKALATPIPPIGAQCLLLVFKVWGSSVARLDWFCVLGVCSLYLSESAIPVANIATGGAAGCRRRRRRRRNCAIASKDDFKLFVVVEIFPQFQ